MRARPILLGALVLSLALNGVLIGYGYTFLRFRPLALLSDPLPPRMLEMLTARLPEQAAGTFQATLQANRARLEQERDAYRAALRQAGSLIEAETVDVEAIRAAVVGARDHRGRMGDIYLDAFVRMIAVMPAEERRALVERFRDR